MSQVKSRKITQVCFAGMLVMAAGSLSACSMDSPTFMAQKHVEVVEDVKHIEVETAQLDEETITAIGAEYLRRGDGPIDIVVTYNPAARGNTAMMATDNAARITSVLGRMNVRDVKTQILPIRDAEASQTLLSYTAYTARAPQGCGDMELVDDAAHENYREYGLGCSTETYLARQISRPQDLLGRDDVEVVEDGRKRANVVEAYKTRIQNEGLTTERPSD